MTWILGISAFYHDSAIAILHDGKLAFAASEERYSRKKHDAGFPRLALQAGLAHCGIRASDIDFVGFYEKPWLKFDRLLETYLAVAPRGYLSFATAMPAWLNKKLYLRRVIRKELRELGARDVRRIVFCEHHQSHAASAFFPSPFDESAILTIDGVGEWSTTSWGSGKGHELALEQEIAFPHSLGLFYSAFTYYCGFRVNSGEYKLMGLAAHGETTYYSHLREHVIELLADGSFRLNMEYFGFCDTLRMTTPRLEELLGFPPRLPEAPFRQQDFDLAASVQRVLEEAVVQLASYVRRQTASPNLCMAGGVALNCSANQRLLKSKLFERIWIQPAAGDAGGSLGVAWLIWHQLLGNARQPASARGSSSDAQQASLLGSDILDEDIQQLLHQGAKGEQLSEEVLLARTADLLAGGAVIGWVQGRMEFGPRALGNRSILADPRRDSIQQIVNEKIKRRESFRPFAPSVPAEDAADYFDLQGVSSSPYMLFTFDVIDVAGESRTKLPGITHADGTARVQTVSEDDNPRFYRLLRQFAARTGVPILLNTSFNLRGEPLVCTPGDAMGCFAVNELDALVIDRYLFLRSDQPQELLSHLARDRQARELD